MRTTSSYIRVLLFVVAATLVLMFAAFPDAPSQAFKEFWVWALIGLLTLIMIVAEICVAALRSVMYKSLSEEARERFDAQEALEQQSQFKWIKKIYKKLAGGRPIEEEHEIILDHNYDGIKELDNKLPPWWLYGFYGTILFAAIYLARFHVFGDYTQAEEFETEMEIARAQVEEWRKNAKDLVDASTVTLLTEEADLRAGKSIFSKNCAICHMEDGGGGIGPNLTDPYWILGGGIKNVFQTISEGGRDGKGMVAWKNQLKPSEIAQVGSYLLTFEGTTPAAPKQAEGEIWIDPEATSENETMVDSVAIDSTLITPIAEDPEGELDN